MTTEASHFSEKETDLCLVALDAVTGSGEPGTNDGGAPDGGTPSMSTSQSSKTTRSVYATVPGLGTREGTESVSTVVITKMTPCPPVWQGIPYR